MNNNISIQHFNISTHTPPSIILIQRSRCDGQAGEGELEGGVVAVNHLRGDVKEDAVVVLVHIVERARRHVEEVLRGQPEGVYRRGHQVRADLLELDRRRGRTIIAVTLAVYVNKLAEIHYTPRAIAATMPYMDTKQIGLSSHSVIARSG